MSEHDDLLATLRRAHQMSCSDPTDAIESLTLWGEEGWESARSGWQEVGMLRVIERLRAKGRNIPDSLQQFADGFDTAERLRERPGGA